MTFESGSQFKAAVKNYAICNGFNVRFERSTENIVEVVCQKHCPWTIYASWGPTREAFVIKSLNDEHMCYTDPTNIHADYCWIAEHFLETIRMDMNYKVVDMLRELQEKYGIIVSRPTCYNASSLARKMLQGSLNEQYHMLPCYVAELQKVNINSTFQLEVENDIHHSFARFKRLYICLESLVRGFLEGCRPVIGLDGCFLKTELKGQLFNAVGRDGNNQMFPIAWAVVEGKNQTSWTWFISLLIRDLGIVDGYGWTIVSDQQEGLENAVAGLLPNAEHRNCARHIYENWRKKGHSTNILRNLFWKAVKCTKREGFQSVIRQMKTLKAEAAQDLLEVGVQNFCRAFISDKPKCEVIDNNMSECFNSFILPSRSKPVIDMLEYMRMAIMERKVKNREIFSESADSLCPRIRWVLEDNRLKCRACRVIHVGHLKFEVSTRGEGYVIDLRAHHCTCRYWAITGIPCPHSIACIHFIRADPANYVNEWLRRDSYQLAYTYGIPPMNGKNMWGGNEGSYLFPPMAKKQPGRPKHTRRTNVSEASPGGLRLTKKGVQMHCSLYNQGGHNRKTCNNRRLQHGGEGSQSYSRGFSNLLKSMTKLQGPKKNDEHTITTHLCTMATKDYM
ncbi:uncharacterized protein LOC144708658 [Wolffia australiana]